MANADAPIGLKPIRHKNGAPYNGSGSVYSVAVGNATALAPGDPVLVTGTADTAGIPGVGIATAGTTNRISGVVIGRTNGEGTLLQTDNIVLPALTAGYVLVEDDPDVVFEVQCSLSIAATDIGSNVNLVSAAASTLGVSQWELNNDYATTVGDQVRVLRLVNRVNNELGTNANVEVMINQHTQSANTVGI
jgi:hypothetical protein